MNRHGDKGVSSPELNEAIRSIKEDGFIPVDLHARLLEQGVNPDALIARYTN